MDISTQSVPSNVTVWKMPSVIYSLENVLENVLLVLRVTLVVTVSRKSLCKLKLNNFYVYILCRLTSGFNTPLLNWIPHNDYKVIYITNDKQWTETIKITFTMFVI